jgi:pyrroline-5-carboxylate reductase
MSAIDSRIIFIGAGKMASAIASGLLRKGFSRNNLKAVDKLESSAVYFEKHTGIKPLIAETINDSFTSAVKDSDIVVLSVKPQNFSELADMGKFFKGKLIISVITGVKIKALTEATHSEKIVRVVPNTPALIGEGISGFAHSGKLSVDELEKVEFILSSIGDYCRVDEKLMDVVTGLSGSGPAYVFDFIQALTDGGVHSGLPRDVAFKLAAKTVIGAAKMLLETGIHPSVLRDQVTSPGGTTARGLAVLERGSFRGLVAEAVNAAAARAAELGQDNK